MSHKHHGRNAAPQDLGEHSPMATPAPNNTPAATPEKPVEAPAKGGKRKNNRGPAAQEAAAPPVVAAPEPTPEVTPEPVVAAAVDPVPAETMQSPMPAAVPNPSPCMTPEVTLPSVDRLSTIPSETPNGTVTPPAGCNSSDDTPSRSFVPTPPADAATSQPETACVSTKDIHVHAASKLLEAYHIVRAVAGALLVTIAFMAWRTFNSALHWASPKHHALLLSEYLPWAQDEATHLLAHPIVTGGTEKAIGLWTSYAPRRCQSAAHVILAEGVKFYTDVHREWHYLSRQK